MMTGIVLGAGMFGGTLLMGLLGELFFTKLLPSKIREKLEKIILNE